jgi:spore germination protein KC
MSATGLSLSDAFRNLQMRLNQQLFYGHTRVIAVSKEVAEKDMAGIVDTLRRSPQIRRLLWLIVTKDEAVHLLETDPVLEQIPIVFVMDMIENGSKSGTIPNLTLGQWFTDRTNLGITASAHSITAAQKDVKWNGIAVFRADSMVGQLDQNATWVLMQVKNQHVGGDITIACPQTRSGLNSEMVRNITAHPKKIHANTKVDRWKDTFRMRTDVLLEVDIVESECNLDFTKESTHRQIERALQEEMDRRAEKLIEDVQHKYRADVFGMGKRVRAKFFDDFERLNWDEVFPKTKIEIKYSVRIRRIGMKMH